MRFEEYGLGSKYNDAHLSKIELPASFVERINDWNKRKSGVLTFCGTPGVGKTYLAAALLRDWIEKGYNPRYLNERSFFNKCRDAIGQGWDYEREIQRLCESSHFILDDIGYGQTTEWQKEILFSFLDTRVNDNKPTLITSNLWISEMGETYGSRFLSRIKDKNNMIIEFKGLDKRFET